MKKPGLWIIIGVGVAAVVAIYFLMHSQAPPASTATTDASTAASSSPATTPAQSAAVQSAAQDPRSDAPQPEVGVPVPEDAKDKMFRTDPSGRLITDEQARLKIEELVALNDPAELQRKVQEVAQTLPPAAAQQLPDLVERYRNYSAAQRQAVPPDQAPSSEQDALTMLETMHALRVQYFGEEIAKGFFAEEEAKQRKMIELMRLQNDQSLTLQERAEKAQALYQSMPELKAREDQR